MDDAAVLANRDLWLNSGTCALSSWRLTVPPGTCTVVPIWGAHPVRVLDWVRCGAGGRGGRGTGEGKGKDGG